MGNGGNKQRGQADGFVIDILTKDKDDNLLAYVVKLCIKKFDTKAGTPEAQLPVPEPGDLEKCQNVDFEQEKGACLTLSKELVDVKRKVELITKSCKEEQKQPFHGRLTGFISKAETEVKRLQDQVMECQAMFIESMKFYKFVPKKGKIEDAKPEEFFSIWYLFAEDCKNIWKKEQRRIEEEIVKETRKKEKEKRKSMQSGVETKKTPVGGIKEKLNKRRAVSRSSSVSLGPEEPASEFDDSKPKKALSKATLSLVSLPRVHDVESND